MPIEVSW